MNPLDRRTTAEENHESSPSVQPYAGGGQGESASSGRAGGSTQARTSAAEAGRPLRASGLLAALDDVRRQVCAVLRGKRQVVDLALTALLARGHILIEDVPGVGKTTLARALARSVGGSFRRIQFTSDLLPADVIGVSVYDQREGRFVFRPGPLFANVVLADEINRTTPRTQSALLEAMAEGQVSVDGRTHVLDRPFLVIATQNPQELAGTYPLPESQMDRFLLRLRIGYPDRSHELALLAERNGGDPVEALRPAISAEALRALQSAVDSVRVDEALLHYAMDVVEQTRRSTALALGVSTRGALAWVRAARAYAVVRGRPYCVPDDFKELAGPALAHRVLPADDTGESVAWTCQAAERALADILGSVRVPH